MAEAKTVMNIEDNYDNRLLIRRLLQAAGYRVIEAANALEAREALKNNLPDLILMDINMPDIDGYTLTAQIKSNPTLSKVPVVAITANVMRGDREKVFQAGCNGYIEKPIDVDKFLDQVALFLA